LAATSLGLGDIVTISKNIVTLVTPINTAWRVVHAQQKTEHKHLCMDYGGRQLLPWQIPGGSTETRSPGSDALRTPSNNHKRRKIKTAKK